MNITVLYFAQLADLAGAAEESVEATSPSAAELFATLKEKHAFPHEFSQVQVAINHQLSSHETPLNEGDTIAFLPPMTGG